MTISLYKVWPGEAGVIEIGQGPMTGGKSLVDRLWSWFARWARGLWLDKSGSDGGSDDEAPAEEDLAGEDSGDDDGGDDDDGDEEEDSEEEEEEGGSKWRAPRDWSRGVDDEDERLIREFLEGNRESFNRLVLKYQTKVFNLCYRLLGDRHEAEDLAQEIFLTIHKSLKNFRGESLFSTWLFRIAVNHGKNRIKYLGRRRYYQSVSMDQPQETEDGDLYHEVEDEGPDPESSISSREVQALVQEAIGELDPDHRLVIVMRDIEDLSYEEIAEVLNIKVGTVKSRIHRARSELKAKLEGKIDT